MIAILSMAALILLIIAPVYLFSVTTPAGKGITAVELPADWRRYHPSWREAIRGDRPSSLAAVTLVVLLILLTGPTAMLLKDSREQRAAELLIFASYAAAIAGPVVLAAFTIIAARTGRARRLLKSGTPVDCFHLRNTVVTMPRQGRTEHGVYLYLIRSRVYRLYSQPLDSELSLSPFSLTEFEGAYGRNGRKIVGRDLSHQETGHVLAALAGRPKVTAAVDPDDPSVAVIVQGFMPTNEAVPANARKVMAGYAILLVVLSAALIGSAWNTLNGSLNYALREKHFAVARVLLSLGADVNARKHYADMVADPGTAPETAVDDYTPLAEAISRDDLESVRFLVIHGADLHERKDNGAAFLETAAGLRSADIMRYLLDQGFDPLHKTADGKTLLMLAVKNGESGELLRLLVERGAPVNERDEQGNTALHYVRPSSWLVSELITLGADIKAKNNNGQTPAEFHAQRSSRSAWPSSRR